MYLFFVRHFNDIDHIVPVVWEMAMDNYAVAVYCLNPEYNLGIFHRFLSFLFLLCFAIKRNSENNFGSYFMPVKKMNMLRSLGIEYIHLLKANITAENGHLTSLKRKVPKYFALIG
jgi:hypothetical protein